MKRSPGTDVASLQRLRRILDAVIVDSPTWIGAMNQARDNGHRSGWPTGQPGGRGGHADLSDRLRYDPAGNLVDGEDPADRALAEFGQFLEQTKRGLMGMRTLQAKALRPEDLTPTGLCRGGMCPGGKMAEKDKGGRCSACSQFWYAISNPDERFEREWVGQPKPMPGQSKVAC